MTENSSISSPPGNYTSGDCATDRDSMSNDELDPMEPAEAIEFYFRHRESELSKSTLENQRYRLNAFLDWCEEEGVTNMNDLTGRELTDFRISRQQDVRKVTLNGHLQTLRVFLEFCATINAVESGLRERVLMPEVDPEEEARDEKLEEYAARAVLEYLDRFQYAGREHVIVAILWHTGIRLGSLRAFDVRDFDPDVGCLDLNHRPETDTPLKNRQAAERSIAVGPRYCEVIGDYIEHNREDVRDDYGRHPLITSTKGRLSATSIRNTIYEVTRPCVYSDCPHGREPATCEAMEYGQASKCPSSRSPHGVRRGSITKHLRDETPTDVVTERMNVSKDVLAKHYDQRTEREKMQIRREFIEDA